RPGSRVNHSGAALATLLVRSAAPSTSPRTRILAMGFRPTRRRVQLGVASGPAANASLRAGRAYSQARILSSIALLVSRKRGCRPARAAEGLLSDLAFVAQRTRRARRTYARRLRLVATRPARPAPTSSSVPGSRRRRAAAGAQWLRGFATLSLASRAAPS